MESISDNNFDFSLMEEDFNPDKPWEFSWVNEPVAPGGSNQPTSTGSNAMDVDLDYKKTIIPIAGEAGDDDDFDVEIVNNALVAKVSFIRLDHASSY